MAAVSAVITPRASRHAARYGAPEAVEDYLQDGALRLRSRLESNPWTYGSEVVDDVKLTLADAGRRFGGQRASAGIFALAGRDRARLAVSYGGAVLFRGLGVDSSSRYDHARERATIHFRSPMSILKGAVFPPALIPNGIASIDALERLFLAGAVSENFSARPDIRLTPLFGGQDARVGAAAELHEHSVLEVLTSLLQLHNGAAVYDAAAERVIIGRRFSPELSGPMLEWTDDDIILLAETDDGSSYLINQVEITYTGADPDGEDETGSVFHDDEESQAEHSVRKVEVDAAWCREPDLLAEYARALTDDLKIPRARVVLDVGLARVPVERLRLMQRVRLRLDGNPRSRFIMGAGSAGERISATDTQPVRGDYAITDLRLDLSRETARVTLQELYNDG